MAQVANLRQQELEAYLNFFIHASVIHVLFMQNTFILPTLQIREMPQSIYEDLVLSAKKSRRKLDTGSDSFDRKGIGD
ncbi:MAG: hypothetical protein IPO92_04740 [Saprospiraceae bacterium]|nr:hypothetical protein [Saprospiraceae bacterium]